MGGINTKDASATLSFSFVNGEDIHEFLGGFKVTEKAYPLLQALLDRAVAEDGYITDYTADDARGVIASILKTVHSCRSPFLVFGKPQLNILTASVVKDAAKILTELGGESKVDDTRARNVLKELTKDIGFDGLKRSFSSCMEKNVKCFFTGDNSAICYLDPTIF